MELIQKAIDAEILELPGPFVGERAPRVFMSREQYDVLDTSEVHFNTRNDEEWYCGHAFECENGEVMLILHRHSTLPGRGVFEVEQHIPPLHPFVLGARCLCHSFSCDDYVTIKLPPFAVSQN
jgi:hypothetical protein